MIEFGGRLRAARERRGLSLRQIATATKIPTASLEALERGHVERLPEGIFRRAIVRAYASEVGLAPEETLREFLARSEPPPAEPPDSKREAVDARQRMAVFVVGVVVLSVVLAAAILLLTRRERVVPMPATVATPTSDVSEDGTGGAEEAARRW